ncbi:hypothetical protein O7599_30005 [Streptomyces sp. WMMC500]|uniref:hypothetical protein n=1 Tax=Streptomyces sp. WMMC500 TaxID=3015154 RepID=UPI00248B66BF|nr:hypothetical protein [Streptomyces sp. WMMC500]WBB59744.1 hypothetical protein O7599_30005 [Streptomyces sp. WMMC500]
MATLLEALLPQPAFAAGSTPGLGGTVNAVTGWFTADDDDEGFAGGEAGEEAAWSAHARGAVLADVGR